MELQSKRPDDRMKVRASCAAPHENKSPRVVSVVSGHSVRQRSCVGPRVHVQDLRVQSAANLAFQLNLTTRPCRGPVVTNFSVLAYPGATSL